MAATAGDLLQRHPRLVVELHADDGLVDMVAGGYDLAIRTGELRDSSLVARRVSSLGYVNVASPAYLAAHGSPSSSEELRAHRRIVHANVEAGREQHARAGQPGEARLILDNEEAMRWAVLAGGGVATLPDILVRADVASGALVSLSRTLPCDARTVHALFPSNRNVPAKTRSFIEFVTEGLEETRRILDGSR